MMKSVNMGGKLLTLPEFGLKNRCTGHSGHPIAAHFIRHGIRSKIYGGQI